MIAKAPPLSFLRCAMLAALLLTLTGTMLSAHAVAGPDKEAPLPVRTATVATSDGEVYYEVHGKGAPLVLISGGPGAPRTSLMPEFDRLATIRSLVYVDNIGRGRSGTLPAGKNHSPYRDAEDIEAVRKALGVEQIELLGHSYGGYAAVAYAARYPNRVRRLVISSSGYNAETWQRNIDNVNLFLQNQYPEVWDKLSAMRASGMKSCAPAYQETYGEPVKQLYWHDQKKVALRKKVSQDPRDTSRPEVYCNMIGDDAEIVVGGAMASFDPRPALAGFRAPTLITAGRHDIICPPRNAFELAQVLPKGTATVEIFNDSAHRPWVEEGDRFFELLTRFLQQ
jgi:proline iminopeptidase